MYGDQREAAATDVAHLSDAKLQVEVRIGGVSHQVDVRVFYSNHCWTKSRTSEPAEAVLCREHKRDGTVDERVYCPARHAFSRQLPSMLASIGHALCIRGRSREVFYRVKSDRSKGRDAGWYVCLRLGLNLARREVTLSVRSAHYRTNRPADVRGKPMRFWAVFQEFYEPLLETHAWLAKTKPPDAPRAS